jgi:hypothetical protein
MKFLLSKMRLETELNGNRTSFQEYPNLHLFEICDKSTGNPYKKKCPVFG